MTKEKGVSSITVNGREFIIMTSAYIKKNKIESADIIFSLGNGKYVFDSFFPQQLLYKSAGYDTNKIDYLRFNVFSPIDWPNKFKNNPKWKNWVSEPKNKSMWKKGHRAVWSYEKHRLGEPIWDRDAKRKLKTLIKRRLASRSN